MVFTFGICLLTKIFLDDSKLQFGGGTLGHPWGNALGVVANRPEACVQARNEECDLTLEGNEIIHEASKNLNGCLFASNTSKLLDGYTDIQNKNEMN